MRVAVFGRALAHCAKALDLVSPGDRIPEAALVDARDPEALASASILPEAVPRVLVCDPDAAPLLRGAGVPSGRLAISSEPAAIGPLLAGAVPAGRAPTRLVVITAPRGGTGRTLLATNLARRLARSLSVMLVDLTGTGAAAWWLGCTAPPWSDLESLSAELTSEHVDVIANEVVSGLRILGGSPVAPSRELALAAARAASGAADLVIVDAPALSEDRARAIADHADRVLVLTYDDPASRRALDAMDLRDWWVIASQSRSRRVAGRAAFRALPRDERAVGTALAGPSALSGALGRAYDELAAVVTVDAT